MFRLRLSLAFAVLVALVCAQAAFVYVGAKRVDDYARHSRLTSDLLSELLELSANKQRLRVWAAQRLMNAGAAPEVRDQLLDRMRAGAQRLAEMSQRHLESWQTLAERDQVAMPAKVEQLVDVSRLLDANIVDLRAQLLQLQPLVGDVDGAPGAASTKFSGVWQQISQVFDTTRGRDLRELVNGAIDQQRQIVPIARAATEGGVARLRTQAIVMAALTFLTALAWALHLNRRLKRPLDRLLEGTQALQSGALDHRIAMGSGDEFDRVARHFNAMAAELQQHRLEADAARRALEDAVAARTGELREAHETLKLVDHRRRQLFADLSHELRTPATAIRGEAQIALRGGDRPAADYRQTLNRILGGVKQLAGVVDDLLLVARAEADQLVIEPAPLLLPGLLAQAAEQAEAVATLHGMRLAFEQAPQQPTVHADAERMRQALMIVLDNAIRYSRPGGTVRFGWRQVGEQVEVIVRDDGIGIDAEELPKVFDRYLRGQRARAHRADGTGIGLSIAQAIVHAHHGSIEIASTAEVGTTVRIVLPCAAVEAEIAT